MNKPAWLKAKIPSGKNYLDLKNLLRSQNLHTVCEEAKCPNIGECWEKRSATVMILGDTCTRSCGFCAVKTGKPLGVDLSEPIRVAESIQQLKLKHVVITSVDRDDLADGGSTIFAETIRQTRLKNLELVLEVLIPDFKGRAADLNRVFEAKPDILNHNLETVARLQKTVRPQASYDCSLSVLKQARDAGLVNKSGLMLGLGEEMEEVLEALQDLRERADCQMITLGQYLSPTQKHLPVARYYTPEEFKELGLKARELGFKHVASGPFVRSSYFAEEQSQKPLFEKPSI